MKHTNASSLYYYYGVLILVLFVLPRIFLPAQSEMPPAWYVGGMGILYVILLVDPIAANKRWRRASHEILQLKSEIAYLNERLLSYSTLNIATKEIFWETDLIHGKATYINNYLTEVLGFSEIDVQTEKDWWESNLHPQDKLSAIGKFMEAINTGQKTCIAEYRFRCKDGSYKVILDSSHIMHDNKGKPYRIIGSMQDITELRNLQEKLLRDQLEHKTEISQAVMKAKDAERLRISAELHDNICQLILSAKMMTTHAQKNWSLQPEQQKLLTLIAETIDSSFTETRNLSHNLNNLWFEKSNLADSVKTLCDQVKNTNSFEITLEAEKLEDALLNSHQKQTLYRIIQEQLMNIAKHAGASLVTICMKTEKGKVYLDIIDNGKGFETDKVTGGIGLRNMLSRVESCMGKMDLKSEPGYGTHLKTVFHLAGDTSKPHVAPVHTITTHTSKSLNSKIQ
jgi:two-component system sensor histidine kinase UhpB